MNPLKGVNKEIVEINYTKNDYIEKAILIINPDKKYLAKSLLSKKAQNYIDSLELPSRPKPKIKVNGLVKPVSFIALGAFLMGLCMYFVK